MNRRIEIRMTNTEVVAFLQNHLTAIVTTNGHDGFPHAVPMWYAVIDGVVHTWTYRKSQKAVNLRRDPRATLLVEDGENYDELRGVMLRCHAETVDDDAQISRFVSELETKIRRLRNGPQSTSGRQKRELHRFVTNDVTSWDHTKLET